MNYNAYKTTLQTFYDNGLTNIELATVTQSELGELLNAQDRLIKLLTEQGAKIAGWKIVEAQDSVVISPIFDFQVFSDYGEVIPSKAVIGTETEVCFKLMVPTSNDIAYAPVSSLNTYVAVELVRPAINVSNNPVCDFYFNYGVLISSKSVTGDLLFKGGNPDYTFAFSMEEVAVKKRKVLNKGIRECIRRGYGGAAFFFITGTLNGLVSTVDSIGTNTLLVKGVESVIHFDVI